MQLTLRVTFNDHTETVATTLATIVAWERKYKRKASQISEGIGIEDLAFMAYESSRAANIVVPATLDMYIASLQNLEVVEQVSPKADAVHTATD